MPHISQAVGHQSPERPVGWNTRDLLLYAVGIGAKRDDFSLAFELDSKWAPFPTYPVVLGLKGDTPDINLFSDAVKPRGAPPPGLPQFDPNRVVHGSQSIEILKPLPRESGDGWKLTDRIVGVHENKSGIIVERENTLVDKNGVAYARLFGSSFNLGAKTTGEKFSKAIAGPPKGKPIPKDRQPDYVTEDKITPEQAILYRLSGDYNPLHIDPRIGQAAGFGGVILHGLCTFGFVARSIVTAVGDNDPNSLVYYGVRFTSPVKPGDSIQTSIWEVGPGPNGTTELAFETKNLTTGKVVLGSGVAYVKKQRGAKL